VNASGEAIVVWNQRDESGSPTTSTVWSNQWSGEAWEGARLIAASWAMRPQVGLDPEGTATVLYLRQGGIASIRRPKGSDWSAPETVRESADFHGSPSLAVDDYGNALAVWSEPFGSNARTWGIRYAAGSGWGTAQQLELQSFAASRGDVAMSPQGQGLAVWQIPDAWRYNVRFAPFDGTTFKPPIDMMSLEGEDIPLANSMGAIESLPLVRMDGQGNAFVIWLVQDGPTTGPSTTRTSLRAVRYDVDTNWELAEAIEPFDSAIRNPWLAVSRDGSAYVAWEQVTDGEPTKQVWCVRFDPQNRWGSPVSLGAGVQPKVAAGDGGAAVVSWGQDDSIVARIRSSAGWQEMGTLTSPGAEASQPEVAMTPGGVAMAVWSQYLGSGNRAVWMNRWK
jgi:hypothetical protein